MLPFILLLMLFVFPTIVLIICGYLHFKNHFKIVIKHNKLNNDKSKSNNSNLTEPNVNAHHPNNQNSNTLNASTQHLGVLPSLHHSHPIHVSQSSHISEMSTFSASYKEQNKYSFKKFKKCFNALKIIKTKDSEWNFFPVSFLCYIFIILLLTLILSLRYKYSIPHTICSTDAPLIRSHRTHIVIDWIVLYCLLLLNIWETLLNFYRFWTTKQCAVLNTNEAHTVYLYYALYAFIFLLVSIVQFHWVYWLFPFIVVTHLSFNVFCIFQFSHILLKQYNTLSEPVIINDNMLSSVRIMMIASLISCVMNSFLFSSIVSCYAFDIIIYLPLIHSISSLVFSFNFVRNRSTMNHCIKRIQSIAIIKRIITHHTNDSRIEQNGKIRTNELRINKHLQPISLKHDHPNAMITPQPPNTPDISVSDPDPKPMEVEINIDDHTLINQQHPSQQTNIVAISADVEDAVLDIEALSSASSDIAAPAGSDIGAPATAAPVAPVPQYISLTPLFGSTRKSSNKNSGTSRSEPSSPLITTQTQKRKKQNNRLSKTPQLAFATRFSPSPGLLSLNPKHWVKTLSLNLGLASKTDEDDDNIYSKVGHKRGCQSEQLQKPKMSEFVTHSISFEERQDAVAKPLSIFGSNAMNSSQSMQSENISDVLENMDKNRGNHHAEIVHEEIDNEEEDVRFDNDALIISPDLAKNVKINEETKEMMPFEKWDAFNAMFPSREPRLRVSASDKQVQWQSDEKRNSNVSALQQSEGRRSCSVMDGTEIAKVAKVIEFELSMANIHEEVDYDLPHMKMLQLMVQHGFVQQIDNYNNFPSSS